jgi:hypothetical protein
VHRRVIEPSRLGMGRKLHLTDLFEDHRHITLVVGDLYFAVVNRARQQSYNLSQTGNCCFMLSKSSRAMP